MAQNTAGQTLTLNNSEVSPGISQGKLVFDATAITATDYVEISCGFKPKYVQFVNATDRITVEHYLGMADDTCVKTAAAGTRTLETSGGVTVSGDTIGFAVLQNKQFRVQALG